MNSAWRYGTWVILAALLMAAPLRAQDDAQPQDPPPITDPNVLGVLAADPTDPDDVVRAINTLINLKHAAAAKPFVDRLVAAQLDEAALASLGRKFGTGTFLRIALQPELNPEAAQLSQAILQAHENASRDPARLAGLIDQLQDPATRARAVVELRRGSDAAVNAMLGVLADPDRAAEHAAVRDGLVAFGSGAAGPLSAALASGNDSLAAQSAEVLGRLRATGEAAFLLGPAAGTTGSDDVRTAAAGAIDAMYGFEPTQEQAATLLRDEIRRYYDGRYPHKVDSRGGVELWNWDPESGTAVRQWFLAEDASLAIALRLARDLRALRPEDVEARRLYLGSLLQLMSYLNGLERPLPGGAGTPADDVAALGPEAVEDMLVTAMAENRTPAATAAARILGDIGSEELLAGGKRLAPLVQAAAHPDRRLRFAAVEAIMKINPTKPYAGSNHVAEALGFMASTAGKPQAIIADHSVDGGQRMAGMLAEFGYDAEVVTSARQLLRRAVVSPNTMFVLMDMELPFLNAGQLVQQLRRDNRSASLPVAFISPLDDLEAARQLVLKHPNTSVFVRPHNPDAMALQIELMLSDAGRALVSNDERLQHAAQALQWIAQEAKNPDSLYDLRPYDESIAKAVYVPELGADAVAALTALGTAKAQHRLAEMALQGVLPEEVRQTASDAFGQIVADRGVLVKPDEVARAMKNADLRRHLMNRLADQGSRAGQRSLVDLASSKLHPMEVRAAAGEAFRRAVEEHGTQLSRDEIVLQYDRYNASEFEPEEVQALLGGILDVLEADAKKAAGQPGNQ